MIVIEAGKIARIGEASAIAIPDGLQVLTAKVATPGLIDAHSVVGVAGYLNQEHHQDQHEGSAPIQPQLRAIDAYNAQEVLVGWLRRFGETPNNLPLQLTSFIGRKKEAEQSRS